MKWRNPLVYCLLLCGLAAAESYYVDSRTGDDANPGTSPDTPWKTLEKANSIVFTPGDKLLFAAGSRYTGQLKPQGAGALVDGRPSPVTIDMYSEGPKPRIDAQGRHKAALYLYNTQYWMVSNLELTNTGTDRQAGRCGALVHIRDFGKAAFIFLSNLYVHDVNGSLVKQQGAGHGIQWQNEGRQTPSYFDGLFIENCHLVRCERNGIMGAGYSRRVDGKLFHPSVNVVIRNNLLEEIPGDGIVPLGCDGALIERNVMRDCTRLLPDSEAAAGIWPWACDNTVIQYNEVSDHKAPWDAQGFDSDWNCTNTLIQYNYSHDNEGGFLLICNNGGAGKETGINNGTVVRYNLSVNDGIRTRPTRQGMFSPTFHITGPCKDTQVYNNVIIVPKKPGEKIDRTLIKMENWGGPWPEDTYFANNIFYVEDEATYDWGRSIRHTFTNNCFYGTHHNRPPDPQAVLADPKFAGEIYRGAGFEKLRAFLLSPDSPCINAGTVVDQSVVDFRGNPLRGTPDIGMHERQGGQPDPVEAGSETVSYVDVHDPHIIRHKEYYYIYSTGRRGQIIGAMRSNDLKHWYRIESPLQKLPAWITEAVPGCRSLWASDVHLVNGRYCLYYSASTFGSQRSLIGMLSNTTLDPEDPAYLWVDEGKIIESDRSKDFNAIDAGLLTDRDGRLWMTWGSFWGGIKMIELDAGTGLPLSDKPEVHSLARRGPGSTAIEAPYMVERDGWYYLFVSWDACCKGVDSTYKIVVGRSKDVLGPYVDAEGNLMTDGGGTLVLDRQGRWIGPGHNSVLNDGGQYYLVYHTYDGDNRGQSVLQIRPLTWDADGWPKPGDILDSYDMSPRPAFRGRRPRPN